MSRPAASDAPLPPSSRPYHIAIVGAGMAGVACARTLVQAGFRVSVFEQAAHAGGRMDHIDSGKGSFDAGVQFFTIRDPRFAHVLDTTVPGLCQPWSATTIVVLDEAGKKISRPSNQEPHWVACPGMGELVRNWAAPLARAGMLHTGTEVLAMERDHLQAAQWQLRVAGPEGSPSVFAGFDAVVLAIPAPAAAQLLRGSAVQSPLLVPLSEVQMEPCWTLMLSFPQAMQPGMTTLGPNWNVASSTHHRIAWLARESSKPGRSLIERWTVHASADWSRKHQNDSPARVLAKLHKAFSEVTGIHAQPGHMDVRLWPHARTTTPLGLPFAWDAQEQFGVCGDWCVGMRVEDAFLSGLELALAIAEQTGHAD